MCLRNSRQSYAIAPVDSGLGAPEHSPERNTLLVNALLSEGYAQHVKIAVPIGEEFCLYSYSGGQLELANNHGFQCALVLEVVLIVA